MIAIAASSYDPQYPVHLSRLEMIVDFVKLDARCVDISIGSLWSISDLIGSQQLVRLYRGPVLPDEETQE